MTTAPPNCWTRSTTSRCPAQIPVEPSGPDVGRQHPQHHPVDTPSGEPVERGVVHGPAHAAPPPPRLDVERDQLTRRPARDRHRRRGPRARIRPTGPRTRPPPPRGDRRPAAASIWPSGPRPTDRTAPGRAEVPHRRPSTRRRAPRRWPGRPRHRRCARRRRKGTGGHQAVGGSAGSGAVPLSWTSDAAPDPNRLGPHGLEHGRVGVVHVPLGDGQELGGVHLDEQPVGLGRQDVAVVHAGPGPDLATVPIEAPGLDPQRGTQRSGLAVADGERPGHSGIAGHDVGGAQHLVERLGDDPAVDAGGWSLVGPVEPGVAPDLGVSARRPRRPRGRPRAGRWGWPCP